MKWLKRLGAVVGVVLLLWATAWVAVPPLVKWQAQTRLSELLGRNVTLGDVAFKPWALELTLRDIVVGAAPASAPAAASAAPLLRVARVRANVSLSSLFRRAPVVEAVDIDAPQLRVARLSAGHYDVDDLIARFTPRTEQPAGPPARFALYNLQVRNGQLRFDDRPAGRVHVVEGLHLALPFLSDLPAQVEITVEPHLAFKLNGASFDSGAQATPFAPTRHAALKLRMADLDVAPYVGYLPASLPLRLTRGALSADLALEFTQPRDGAPSASLRGWVAARDLALSSATGAPLLSWQRLRIELRDVQPLARRLALDKLRIEGLSASPATSPPLQIGLSALELADVRVSWSDGSADAPQLQVAVAQTTLDALRVQPGAAFERLTLGDLQLDLAARTVTLASVKLLQPALQLDRDSAGRLNVVQWMPSPSESAEAPALPWHVQLHSVTLEGGRVGLSDAFVRHETRGRPLRAELNQVQLAVQDFAWPGDSAAPPAKLQFSARVASPAASRAEAARAGLLDWQGEFGLHPLLAAGNVRIVRFPAHLLAAYIADRLPVSLLRAEAGYSGRLSVREQGAGWAVAAAGDVLLGDVHVTTLPDAATPSTLASGADELLNWQSFALKRVKFNMKPGTQPQLEIGEAALSDFYSRLNVTEEGRFNLQAVGAPAAAASAPDAAASAAAPAGLPLDISVGVTKLNNGRIDFSDHFVRPNYSAALTELNGELGPFRSTTRDMATLQLRGRAAGTALLDISGQINPTVKPLALDIKARATDLELAPLSPYAGKYAGYAIERGKLSLEVAYKIDADGKLEASNQLTLNQLTFGERIESPSATKLPVLFAVALLKDRNGVIDINLPISGSVNDPKFSVGGIILKLIVNLIGKALTAPFALLAGGGGQDLSLVEFNPGSAVIAEAGSSAIDKVAKALTDRPTLQMTVTGTADPVSEREAVQREAIDARLIAERRREGLRVGAAASAPVTLAPDERARLLKALYKQTELPDKPRNAIGFAKDIPGPEMEALLRKHVPVTDETMHELALQRGLAVRDALIAKGLPSERLFVAAPKLHAPGDGDAAAWTPRVQLALSIK